MPLPVYTPGELYVKFEEYLLHMEQREKQRAKDGITKPLPYTEEGFCALAHIPVYHFRNLPKNGDGYMEICSMIIDRMTQRNLELGFTGENVPGMVQFWTKNVNKNYLASDRINETGVRIGGTCIGDNNQFTFLTVNNVEELQSMRKSGVISSNDVVHDDMLTATIKSIPRAVEAEIIQGNPDKPKKKQAIVVEETNKIDNEPQDEEEGQCIDNRVRSEPIQQEESNSSSPVIVVSGPEDK